MQIDIGKALGAVTRTVRAFDKDGQPASTVVLARYYDTDIDDLWDALTNPARLPRWFLPIEGELKLGGRYQLKGNAGGTVTACDPPRHFAATWEFMDKVTWIDVRLAREGGKTHFTLEHTALHEEHWDQFGPGAVGIGWDLAVAGLEGFLKTKQAVRHDEAEAWMMSADGKAFMGLSGDAWCAAHIASGVSADYATPRSQRTIAFFRGELPPECAHPGTGS